MLARIGGGNGGIVDYLEHGKKQDREYTRDELDKRVILDGDLALTESIINSIPDKGQERYLHITLSFHESEVSDQLLNDVTQEYKKLLMNAYGEDEFNFYAEAHLPKIKNIIDNKTGDSIERKPHIHIVIPEKNLITGNKLNPAGLADHYIPQLDAIQEFINTKYNLVSPKDGVRVSDRNHAHVLSRVKGDTFKESHAELKQAIVSKIENDNVRSMPEFVSAISEFGEVREYNKGKPNNYFGVKPEGEKKFIRLKSPLFSKRYIEDRKIELIKPTPKEVESRLNEWVTKTSHEIKHIHPASDKIRKAYAVLNPLQKASYLKEVIDKYEQKNGIYRSGRRPAGDKPRTEQHPGRTATQKTIGLPRLPMGNLVYGLHGSSERGSSNKSELLLPKYENSNLSAPGRETFHPDRNVRRLQSGVGRGRGRGIARSPIEQIQLNTSNELADLPFLKQIRDDIEPERFLSWVHSRFCVDPAQHPVSFTKDGSPRFRVENRNLNASDFLTKYLNLEWSEAKENLLDIWQTQVSKEPYHTVYSKINLTREQAKQRFAFLNEHKKYVSEQVKVLVGEAHKHYQESFKGLLSLRDKKEREVERGYIIFKKMESLKTVNSIKRACYNEINAYFNHWQPNRNNIMALGDSLKKFIKTPIDGNSISSGAEKYSVAERVKRTLVAEEYTRRELTDLVAHKVNPKEIRYLDPKTKDTFFVDKGDHVRIGGNITQEKTEAMLLYAAEKYGGVLKLTGSEEFKVSCAMAAAEKGMKVILQPDKYHEVMQKRIEEIQLEKVEVQENTITADPAREKDPVKQPESEKSSEAEQPPRGTIEKSDQEPEVTRDGDNSGSSPAVEGEKSADLASLKDEAEKLTSQQQDALHLLDEAQKNGYPEEEIKVLGSGLKTINTRLRVVNDQVKQIEAETAQRKHEEQKQVKPDERSLNDELSRLSEKLADELGLDKSTVRESLESARFKDVEDLENCLDKPEMMQAIKNDAINHHKQKEVDLERQRSNENERSR